MKKKKGTNVYERKITLGRDENGMPVRKSITAKTIVELNQRIEQAKQQWMRMHDFSGSVQFATYARKWLATAKAVKSLNTRAMYDYALEKHIIPEIGDLYFSEISLSDLQTIINERADKYETCNKIRLTLRQIYAAAIDEGISTDVKASKLVLPPKKKTEKRALTEEEKEAIFNADLTDVQRVFVHTLYYTGIRREEILALNASDLDWAKHTLTVRKTIVFDENNPIVNDLAKTPTSLRSIPIPTEFREELRTYATGKDILFPMQRRGGYMSYSSYVKFWRSIKNALIPLAPSAKTLTAHIFRHNYATMLYYSNISVKKAAQLMGHSNPQMIMQIYAHLDEEQERTVEKLDSVFTRKKTSKE